MIPFVRLLIAFVALAAPSLARAQSPWERRAEQEEQWRSMGLSLIPHQQSYFMPFTYNRSPHASAVNESKQIEAKFQFSAKVLLMNNIFRSNVHLYLGYTQLAMWQVYNREQSAPFRDTNHEPELFLTMAAAHELGPVTLRQTDFGVVHQSNGVVAPDSRSWNRVFARFMLDRDNVSVGLRPWIRLPETGQDDNGDIKKYLGHGELTASIFRKNHVVSLILRNNLRRKNKGALQLEYSFPLTRNLTGLVQYFNGYGESLIDYNQTNNRLSVGIALSDWH